MGNFKMRIDCPACRSVEYTILITTPYSDSSIASYLDRYYSSQGHPDFSRLSGEEFRLARCNKCGLIFQDRVPTDEFLVELYEKWITPCPPANGLQKADESARRFRDIRLILRIIRHLRKPSHVVRVLDFGMGWCEWLFAARGLGCEIYGLELSSSRIAFAAANGVRVLKTEELSNHTFDIINCEQVLEHLEDPRGVLQSLQRCLGPDGVIILGVPNVGPVERRLGMGRGVDWSGERHSRQRGNPTEAVTPLEHLNSFNGDTLRSLANRCGLREVHFSVADLIRTTTFDFDSIKDALKALMIRSGFTNSFTSVILARENLLSGKLS